MPLHFQNAQFFPKCLDCGFGRFVQNKQFIFGQLVKENRFISAMFPGVLVPCRCAAGVAHGIFIIRLPAPCPLGRQLRFVPPVAGLPAPQSVVVHAQFFRQFVQVYFLAIPPPVQVRFAGGIFLVAPPWHCTSSTNKKCPTGRTRQSIIFCGSLTNCKQLGITKAPRHCCRRASSKIHCTNYSRKSVSWSIIFYFS